MDELNQKSVISLLKEDIYDILISTGVTISTAESCTGGNLASLFTYFSGSSTFYKGGIIAYANEVKTNLLGVDAKSLVEDGAVSESVVVEMAKGVQRLLKSDCSIATSGIAGPLGGTVDKPVGTVWIAVVYKTKIITYKQQGDDGREINIIKACGNALRILKEVLVDKY